ncbi:AP-4 complex subunit mu-1 [Thraustotheca clavata]|uniref:AP-4 complex subunit mu-1 n=1 Tax=Thraustotheca clavata TaxID=74557 RepID=A0A1V9YNM5_9STRA|nr:AP-4 complex subunit mu-1 [Thraustotheca clavata]
MSISQFYILSSRGDTVLANDFRGDVASDSAEIFFRKAKFWDKGDAPPAFHVDGVNYLYVKKNGLYFVATTRFNVSPAYILELLTRLCRVFKDYCGVLSEETLQKNFILCYELLDETMDYGYAQDTSTEGLKVHVHNEAILVGEAAVAKAKASGGILGRQTNIKPANAVRKPVATGQSSNKKDENELFCDILERLNVVFSPSGQMLNASVEGRIQMKSYLAGNPELRLALNEDLVIGQKSSSYGQVVLDDCNFHECVQLDEFERDRVLVFTPPDGEFTVINYRITGDFRAPFRIFPFLEEQSPTKLEMILKIRADMPDNNYGANVIIRFPVPQNTVSVSCDIGKNTAGQLAEYRENENQVRWAIKRFPGASEFTLRAKITLSAPSLHVRREIGPVSMNFEIPMYNVSTLQVRYLRIPEHARHPNYKYKRWVRYVTQSSSYVSRI